MAQIFNSQGQLGPIDTSIEATQYDVLKVDTTLSKEKQNKSSPQIIAALERLKEYAIKEFKKAYYGVDEVEYKDFDNVEDLYKQIEKQ